MPIVRINCLPVKKLDLGLAVRGVTSALATATEIDPEHISVLWNELSADSYAHRGDLAELQPQATHPILIDLIAPDFHRPHLVQLMMKTLAHEVAVLTGADHNNILIIHQPQSSGHVYDQGRLVSW